MSLPNFNNLPEPSAEEQALSLELVQHIRDKIDASNGRISFAQYMEMCLYTPGLGYYVNGRHILGEGGDFTTAPELTPLYSQCVARQAMQIGAGIGEPFSILEFGGGNGCLAADALAYLDSQGNLPEHYYILDVSPYLQAMQKERISQTIPSVLDRVKWIQNIPPGFRGVVLANEVLDAMPVHLVRFYSTQKHTEMAVQHTPEGFEWMETPIEESELQKSADAIFAKHGKKMVDGYIGEINLFAGGWLKSLYEKMDSGVVLLIDYGYPDSEWYIPERRQGTLMCHYRHRAHSNPLILAGLQDLTAHVDFTAIAESAHEAGFTVNGFNNQTGFLIGCGIEELLQDVDTSDTQRFLEITSPVKRLLLPQEMGELFKVMALSKDIDEQLVGFYADNRLDRL